MHEIYIYHMDLKPDNFFLDKDDKIYIGDLGSSQYVPKQDKQYTIINPYFNDESRFISPALITKQFSSSSIDQTEVYLVEGQTYDIYSLGCCLYYMMTGKYLQRSLQTNDQQYIDIIQQAGHKIADIVYNLTCQFCCFRLKDMQIIQYINEILNELQQDKYQYDTIDYDYISRLSGFGQKICCNAFCQRQKDTLLHKNQRSKSMRYIKFKKDDKKWYDDQDMLLLQKTLRRGSIQNQSYFIGSSEVNTMHQQIKYIQKKINKEQQKIQMLIQQQYCVLLNIITRQIQTEQDKIVQYNEDNTSNNENTYLKIDVNLDNQISVQNINKTSDTMVIKVGRNIVRQNTLQQLQDAQNQQQDENYSDKEILDVDSLLNSFDFLEINKCDVSYSDF